MTFTYPAVTLTFLCTKALHLPLHHLSLIQGSTNEHILKTDVSASVSYWARRRSIDFDRASKNGVLLYLFFSLNTFLCSSLVIGITSPALAIYPSRYYVATLNGSRMSCIIRNILRSSLHKKIQVKVCI